MISSCKNKQNDDFTVYGKWKWIKTSGGIAGVTLNEITEGYSQSLEINSDSTFIVYRNDEHYDEGEIKLVKGRSIYRTGEVDLIKVKSKIISPNALVSFAFKSDTILLFEECFDCFTHVFVKSD